MSQNLLKYICVVYYKLIIPPFLRIREIVLNGSLKMRTKYLVSSSLHWSLYWQEAKGKRCLGGQFPERGIQIADKPHG